MRSAGISEGGSVRDGDNLGSVAGTRALAHQIWIVHPQFAAFLSNVGWLQKDDEGAASSKLVDL